MQNNDLYDNFKNAYFAGIDKEGNKNPFLYKSLQNICLYLKIDEDQANKLLDHCNKIVKDESENNLTSLLSLSKASDLDFALEFVDAFRFDPMSYMKEGVFDLEAFKRSGKGHLLESIQINSLGEVKIKKVSIIQSYEKLQEIKRRKEIDAMDTDDLSVITFFDDGDNEEDEIQDIEDVKDVNLV